MIARWGDLHNYSSKKNNNKKLYSAKKLRIIFTKVIDKNKMSVGINRKYN